MTVKFNIKPRPTWNCRIYDYVCHRKKCGTIEQTKGDSPVKQQSRRYTCFTRYFFYFLTHPSMAMALLSRNHGCKVVWDKQILHQRIWRPLTLLCNFLISYCQIQSINQTMWGFHTNFCITTNILKKCCVQILVLKKIKYKWQIQFGGLLLLKSLS